MAGISIPFRFNEFGQVETAVNESKYWKDQILLTIMTRFGERVFRPSFGSGIGETLFEPADTAAETAVRTINVAFNTWLPRLTLTEVSPRFNYDTGFLEVTVLYVLPSGQSDTITLNTAILNRTGDIIEEIPSGR